MKYIDEQIRSLKNIIEIARDNDPNILITKYLNPMVAQTKIDFYEWLLQLRADVDAIMDKEQST